jgi:phospholipid/cholesterol/gamma-HCH transport system ATP-binding protein
MNSARRIANRIAMIHEGSIQWIGNATDIDKTDNPFVHQFIHGLSKGPITGDVK